MRKSLTHSLLGAIQNSIHRKNIAPSQILAPHNALNAYISGRGKKKAPNLVGSGLEVGRRPTLPLVAVPSALAGLTALFGMGRGDPRRRSRPEWVGHGGTAAARPVGPPTRSESPAAAGEVSGY